MTKDKFIHGIHEKEAEKYLKQIGVYDKVVDSALFKGKGFELIIAANIEYNSRNKDHE